ncbi:MULTISPECIES: DUF927 domain-containing protein [unclassified Rhizobacter]|uniref:DUF927 domain-containing protein n=1 Tax=unclassified Rhizobacter TaxID=2640088 RepID=UPI0006FCE606|nr:MULTISPECIES: DUF927 domain-containing protein [unclassified Rhizobacter]KQU80385.1 hypothetical protein ASC88_17315 [Rhizobacter sp. Root29]KQW13883.1 hypothetical protein ASC98_17445 [Rhizobacter sp. Root1238]
MNLVRDALACIPADIGHDERARIAFAVYEGLGDAGADAWFAWAEQRPKPDQAEDKATWRSAKKPGKVTVATLFGLAKERGFTFPNDAAAAPALTPDQVDAQAQERAQARAVQEEEYRRRADQAAREAQRLWSEAGSEGNSPYLLRKGVQGHGLRYLADGTLLVPMRNAVGELMNVQRIAPAKPSKEEERQGKTEKRYLPGGRKSGLLHWIGQPGVQASALLVAEGYATAATLHEATGHPVAVAFDAGNLGQVAGVLRSVFPKARILVCGDDDAATAARTGTNPGREKALAAARSAAAEGLPPLTAFPEGLPEGGSDFNDLAVHAGLPAVAAIIDAALRQEVPADKPARKRASKAATPAIEKASTLTRSSEERPATKAAAKPPAEPEANERFSVTDNGVWLLMRDEEGNEKRPVWLCSRLVVTARTRSDDANGWGYLLQFADPDGNPKSWAMPSSMLGGDSTEWACRLRDMGLQMAAGNKARAMVAQYIDSRKPVDRVTCTDRVGWHGGVYVLPSDCVGETDGRRFVFQSEAGMEDTYRREGTLQQWRENIAAKCVGNSRLVFALSCAFAGPMTRLAEMESGGFHLRGDSSMGKTTALRIAASVWGRPNYMQRWRTTDNALEATAVQHCDSLLILDEFGQLDPKVAGECAYMLANDQEKGRATRNGLARKRRTWRLLFLSSGELSLAQHMEAASKTPRAGQEVRMLDIPLDAGAGMGGLEELHGHGGPAALADDIVTAAAKTYGQAGHAWLEWACKHHAELPARLADMIRTYRDDFVPEGAAEQVRRAGARFALVAAAGELATEAGITGWVKGEARAALSRCFNAWIESRGHSGNGEDYAMHRQVRKFLELHGAGRFTWWHRGADDHSPNTLMRAGFRRMVDAEGKAIRTNSDHQREFGERMQPADGESTSIEYFVLPEVFRSEMCAGYDYRAVCRTLAQRGHLETGPHGRFDRKERLPGIGPSTCYRIKASIFGD